MRRRSPELQRSSCENRKIRVPVDILIRVYPYSVRADAQLFFVLWKAGEPLDQVLATDGRVISFPTRTDLERYAVANDIQLEKGDDGPLDLDLSRDWLRGGAMPDLDVLLNVWNLAGDVARGTGRAWSDRSEELDHVYDLLFAGNNLPSVTPPVEHFTPKWTGTELDVLRHQIGDALVLIRRSLGLSDD